MDTPSVLGPPVTVLRAVSRRVGGLVRGRGFAINLWLIALVLTALVVAFTVRFVQQERAQIELTSRERAGLGYSFRNESVLHELRRLRDRVAVDGMDGRPDRERVQVALDSLYAYNSSVGRDPTLTKRLARFQMRWASIAAGSRSPPQIEATIATAEQLFSYIDDLTYLSTDRDTDTAELIDALGTQLPALAESTDRAKVMLLRGPGASRGTQFWGGDSAALLGQARWAFALAINDISASTRDDPALGRQLDAPLRVLGARLRDFAETVRTADASGIGAVGSAKIRRGGDAVEAAAYAAHHAVISRVDRRLAERARSGEAWAWLTILFGLLAEAIIVAILAQIGRTIWHSNRIEQRRAQAAAARLSSELARRRAVEQLSISEARFRAVFDGSSIGVAIIAGDGTLLNANRALHVMLGDVRPELVGVAHPSFRSLIEGKQDSFATEISTEDRDGTQRWFDVSVSLVRYDDGRPLFAMSMVKDMTDRKRLDERLMYDATHDALSGLPNRALFFDELRGAYARAATTDSRAAVLFIDLDEFKFINDSLGHTVGDRVLVAVAARLQEAAGRHDVVARLGGDEFAILAQGRRTKSDVAALVSEIERALGRPLRVDGRDIFVTASIGVAMVEPSYRAVDDILRDADTAMYHAKSSGRARHAMFDRAMHAHATRRLQLATELRYAIERDEFHLVYQPIVSLASNRIESWEALLRWEHRQLGPIAPAEFIPIAEDLGLIVSIGRMVLDRACAQLSEWKRRRVCSSRTRINVNASVREIVQPDYGAAVAQTLERHGLRPRDAVLEITEGGLLTSGKFTDSALDALKATGVALSIDDFGTGYSSLRYLHQFPFDELKIDRSFVAGPGGELASEAIVTMLIALGRALGVSVVAEGVETSAQAARLRALGCARAQGYHFGAPSRADGGARSNVVEAVFAS